MPRGKNDVEECSGTDVKEERIKKRKSKSQASTSITATADSSPSAAFTAKDFAQLAENEHSRYAPNATKIAHSVIKKKGDELVAEQYAMPEDDTVDTLIVRPLINIEAIERYGMRRYRAETPDGKTPMYAKRFIQGCVGDSVDNEESIEIALFSPTEKSGKEPFWGSSKPTPILSDNLSKAVKHDLKKELQDVAFTSKGGQLQIDHASVAQRDQISRRVPDQNTVMGESARDAYENFFEAMSDELHPDLKQRLKRAFNADIKDHLFKNNHRPEWLHAHGWSLMPMDKNPQTTSNLGAGPKWANTQMMILERIVKWFAINSPESLLTIEPKFNMLLDSELIQNIDFKVRVQIKERYVQLMNKIDTLQAFPHYAKSSDLAQGAAITHSILHEVQPVSTQVIKETNKHNTRQQVEVASVLPVDSIRRSRPTIAPLSFTTLPQPQVKATLSQPLVKGFSKVKPTAPTIQLPQEVETIKRQRRRDSSSSDDSVNLVEPSRSNYPTQEKHDKSVVQIYATASSAEYDTPWQAPGEQQSTGSGFVIGHSGKNYILTNAHVAENAVFLQVRLANDRLHKYEAKVKCVAYQCDLALLEVDDPQFHLLVEPVKFGKMVDLRQKVMVAGFPMGGTEISLSKGIVSRIEVDGYAMSDQDLLQVQIDAAVNPGNSGGPVFSGEKVVGVAFQGYDKQGLSYMIPMPIVQHFIKEVFSGKPYRGFPTIPFITEELENAHERAYYHLGNRTGVRILRIDNLSDAYSKLKSDDIILAIDGMNISNEATVDIPGIGKCINFIHVTQSKFIGDTVCLKILRQNEVNIEEPHIFEVDITLDVINGDTERVSITEHDKMPTYYINSGICFIPLTRNYIEGEGDALSEIQVIEEGCSLINAPKKRHGDQIIVISHVLKCNETQGYDKHLNSLVKSINGKEISNIQDVIKAMEGNSSIRQVITLTSKSKIVVPNMTPVQFQKLLKRYHIPADRSEDLMVMPIVDGSLFAGTPITGAPIRRASPIAEIGSESPDLFREEHDISDEIKPPKLKRKRPAFSSSSEEEEPVAVVDRRRKKRDHDDDEASGSVMMPGVKRFMDSIASMEKHYKDMPVEDDEDEDDSDYDDELSHSDLSEIDLEETESDDDSTEEESPAKVVPLLHRRNAIQRHGFFNASKKQAEDEAVEQKKIWTVRS